MSLFLLTAAVAAAVVVVVVVVVAHFVLVVENYFGHSVDMFVGSWLSPLSWSASHLCLSDC